MRMEKKAVRSWVASNATGLTSEEEAHVAMCLEHILEWYFEGRPLGEFLAAVARNDFRLACLRADGMNLKALRLYALFMHNHIPDDYVEKALSK